MAYVAAAMIIAAVALFVAAPLAGGFFPARRRGASELDRERLEHERGLAVQGLRELEFDREMGKLSAADYESMHKALEERALTAMASVENFRLQTGKAANRKKPSAAPSTQAPRPTDAVPSPVAHAEPPQPPQSAPSPPRKIRFCSQCGTRTAAGSKFCAQCGLAIAPMGGATAWTE